MIEIDSPQWLSWLTLYFWPLLRILALSMTAPILSERAIPKRVKIGLGLAILIGVTLGFTMQLAFASRSSSGEYYFFWYLMVHLWLFSLLIDSFHTLPITGKPINSNAFIALYNNRSGYFYSRVNARFNRLSPYY
ncbi:unnamed protein product [Ranitomeya imitator]|uniref:Uncharacterized protein n=1 Tax=Ranitomeya imitator TaxID=111125 RepID=A0ABN9LPL2_9NEOB|nr:unnamed protein product [Ranitomeya imitator]